MNKHIWGWLLMIPLFAFMIAGCSGGNEAPGEGTSGNMGDGERNNEASADRTKGELPPLEESATVVIAEDGSASGAGFYIAKEKGYFEDYNINVEFATFSNSDDMLPALAAGEIDVAGGISSASFFNSIAQGINVKMIADKGHNIPGQSYFSFVKRADLSAELQSYADVKGKRVAVSTKNAVDDYIFGQMIEHAGLSRDDVAFVLMPEFGNMIASMANESIDVALQIEPLMTQGETRGVHERFGDATDFAPEAQIAMVLGSPQLVNEEEDVALRFMVAYLQGVRDYNDAFLKGERLDDIIEIMVKHTPLEDPAIWKKVGVTGLHPNGEMFVDNIKDQYEWYKKNGSIQGEIDFNKAVDTSIAEEAVEILGEYPYDKVLEKHVDR